MAILSDIQSFTHYLTQTPMNYEEIEGAKEIFSKLSDLSTDSESRAALDEARVVLQLREEQSEVATKVATIYLRQDRIEQALPKLDSKDFYLIKEKFAQLQADAMSLPAEAYFPDRPKEQFITKLAALGKALDAHDPTAWKTDAVARAVISAGIGAIFASYPKWIEAHSLPSTYFAAYGSMAHWSVGLGFGAASMSCAYALEIAIPYVMTQVTRVQQKYSG